MSHENFKFQIEHILDAPRARVWKAWTNQEELKAWFGPKGCPVFASKLDFREDGVYHYGMKTPDGGEMWGVWIFKEIKAPEKLVTIVSFCDAEGEKIIRHPWNENWPMRTHSVLELNSLGDQTKLSITWSAHHPTETESQAFFEGKDSMAQGWGGTLEQLVAYLEAHK